MEEELSTSRSRPPDFPEYSVRWPQPYDIVDDPIEVSGISRAFEGGISIRVLDGNGNPLTEVPTMGGSMGTFAKFREQIILGSTPSTPQGTVEVFAYSARDGSEINKVVVPIVFGRNLLGHEFSGFDTYEVQAGDSLSSIARADRDPSTTWQRIYEANRDRIDNPNRIFPGQVLRIPR